MAERVEIIVTGWVQGVAFRWYTVQQAGPLQLSGTIRNLLDGSVRIVAEGERSALELLLNWVREGPPHARVDETTVLWSEATGEFDDFRITG